MQYKLVQKKIVWASYPDIVLSEQRLNQVLIVIITIKNKFSGV